MSPEQLLRHHIYPEFSFFTGKEVSQAVSHRGGRIRTYQYTGWELAS